MIPKERILLVIDLMSQGVPDETRFRLGNLDFVLQTHRIGWDFETAESLIKKYDGYVDGIALSGIRKKVSVGRFEMPVRKAVRLIRTAKKSSIYLGEDLRELFANWTLRRIIKEHPQTFNGKKTLFHCAVATPFLSTISDEHGIIWGADALTLAGVPLLLKGEKALQAFLRTTEGLKRFTEGKFNPSKNKRKSHLQNKLSAWISECDIFVTYASLLESIEDFSSFKDKIIIVDFLKKDLKEKIEKAQPLQVIEFVPQHPKIQVLYDQPFSVMTAVIDQLRIAEDSPISFDEYVIRMTEKLDVIPNRLKNARGLPRRCAFVVHPLSQKDIWKAPGLNRIHNIHPAIKDMGEKMLSRLPIFHYGELKGVVSQATGQEVVCDIYAILATPKRLLEMDEEDVYRSLVKGAQSAQKKGAAMMGLGAYTKIVGDAGVTVARRSPIPITTGNSYSASTTLWAAKTMVDRMGFVEPQPEGKLVDGKAMIIGATGSIGRVASLLVSLVFKEVVLVATRPDKLLELRQEVRELSPQCQVTTTVDPNSELVDTDLVVTATSNQSGSILDIERVKPGAVICDCSRPLDITEEEAAKRPDVLVIESGEVDLPGTPEITCDIGLPKPSVYACLAETVLLTMEGRYEPFSLSRDLSWERTKEIFKIGLKHGAKLSAIRGHQGVIRDEDVETCRQKALASLKSWPKRKEARFERIEPSQVRLSPGLTQNGKAKSQLNQNESPLGS